MNTIGQGILNNKHVPISFSLQKGQYVTGKIVKLFKGQFAMISISGKDMTAKLDVPVQANERYWFKVTALEPCLTLQIEHRTAFMEPLDREQELSFILNAFGVDASALSKRLLKYFSNNGLPIEKETFNQALHLLSQDQEPSHGVEVIRYLLENRFPLKAAIYQSIKAYQQTKSLASMLTSLSEGLNTFQDDSNAVKSLINLLKQWPMTLTEAVDVNRINTPGTKDFLTALKALGLSFESQIKRHLSEGASFKDVEMSNVKSLLLEILQENHLPDTVKNIVSNSLDILTGHQLHVGNQNQSFLQLVYDLPLKLQDTFVNSKLVWEGKKNKTGQLDPDHCKILFQLRLKNLGETILQMDIHHRFVSIKIYQESQMNLSTLIKEFSPLLKERLSQHAYQVASIVQIQSPPSNGMENLHGPKNFRMDVSI